jgi:hypothetical protein
VCQFSPQQQQQHQQHRNYMVYPVSLQQRRPFQSNRPQQHLSPRLLLLLLQPLLLLLVLLLLLLLSLRGMLPAV